MKDQIQSIRLISCVFALALFSANQAAASVANYLVTVNTSAVNGTSGFLDFQFNPGLGSAQLANAQMTSFNPDNGTLVSNINSPQRIGDVSGTLPGVVTFDNLTGFNDYFHQFTYGSFFSFILELTGPALTAPDGTSTAGTTFGVSLLDSNQNPILTSDPNGFVGTIEINLDGTTTVHPFLTATGGSSVFSAVTPEPAGVLLFVFGIAGLALLRRTARG